MISINQLKHIFGNSPTSDYIKENCSAFILETGASVYLDRYSTIELDFTNELLIIIDKTTIPVKGQVITKQYIPFTAIIEVRGNFAKAAPSEMMKDGQHLLSM